MRALLLLLLALPARAEWSSEFARGAAKVQSALQSGRREEAVAALKALKVPEKGKPADLSDMHRKRAEFASALDDLPAAEADLRAALAAAPKDFETLCTLTQFLRERGRYADSLAVAQVLSTVTEGIPAHNRAEKWLQRGETLMRLRRYDESVADVSRALRDKPEDVPSLWLMAQVLLRAGRAKEALPFADRMIAAAADPAEKARAYAQRAQVRETLGDKAGSEADVDAALAADPSDHIALEARVQRLRADGRYREAMALADRMVAAGASAPPTQRALLYEQRAEVERLLGETARAEADLRAALAIEPDSQPVLHRLAEFLLDDGRGDEAVEAATAYLKASAEAAPSVRAEGLILRARAHAAAGRDEAAAADRAEARRLAPDSATALRDSAAAALSSGDAAGAAALYDRLAAAVAGGSAAERAEALEGRGSARLAAGRRAAAREDFLKAAELAPRSLFAQERLTALALEDGRFAEAESRAQTLFELAGSTASRASAAALVLRARARAGRGKRGEAVADLSAALAADPSSRDALSALVDALSRQGAAKPLVDAADRLFRASAAAPPEDEAAFKAMVAVVSALTRMGRADLALSDAEVLVARAAGGPAERAAESLCMRAAARDALGRSGDALADLDAAAAAAPGRLDTLRRRARLLARLGRGAEALAAADALVAASTASTPAAAAEARLWRADRRADASDAAGAEADHAAAEAAVPGIHARSADAGARWARSVAALRGEPAARALLARLRSTPGATAAARAALGAALAESLWSSGDAAGGAAAMAAALAADAPAACRATLLRERGAAATSWFDACLARLPSDAELRTDRGVSRWTAGRRSEAEADFRAALAARPGFLPAAMSLASALEAGGKRVEASAVLRKALSAKGTDPALVPDAKAQLERLVGR